MVQLSNLFFQFYQLLTIYVVLQLHQVALIDGWVYPSKIQFIVLNLLQLHYVFLLIQLTVALLDAIYLEEPILFQCCSRVRLQIKLPLFRLPTFTESIWSPSALRRLISLLFPSGCLRSFDNWLLQFEVPWQLIPFGQWDLLWYLLIVRW